MIAIIDYGVGNLFSLKSSFAYIGKEAVVTSDRGEIEIAERIILPGVGAFADARAKLAATGLDTVVKQQCASGKPLLGICLGMQLLFEKSYEYGECEGLSLIPGSVVPMKPELSGGLKVPHIGWNALKLSRNKKNEKSKLYKYVDDGVYVYFVHSYYAAGCDEYISATAEYGIPLTASAENGNVYGTQFHPEKSGETGLSILKAFCEL